MGRQGHAFPALADGAQQFWQGLWTTFVPPRVRVQAWRFCDEATPTMANLAQKHAGVETHCVLCGAEVETTKHVLLEGPFARVVWALSHIPWVVLHRWDGDTAGWFSAAIRRLGLKGTPRFLMLCWALWRNRNRRRMEGVVWEPLQVVNDALLLLSQYQEARTKLRLGLLR
ncbi:hypothetical protein Salat_2429100 [Sesamum alatum]|uniref:Reverse transcriptase zinc-binding domain-containing protein n=1 Tax=Sesamum alatum TaxID=300844 RepID=A0AAE1XYW1_9LAMI|nr:hypothetical protein Salat_2429100 [Sesamum alatum]